MTGLAPSINTTVSHFTVSLFPTVERVLGCLVMLERNESGAQPARGGMGVGSGGVPVTSLPLVAEQ